MRVAVHLAAVLLLVVAAPAAAQRSPTSDETFTTHRFSGYFRCQVSDPKASTESCLVAESRENQTRMTFNETWTRLHIQVTWAYSAAKGIQALGLLVQDRDGKTLGSNTGSYGIELNITAPADHLGVINLTVVVASSPSRTPRAYDQSFGVEVREFRPRPTQPPAEEPPASQGPAASTPVVAPAAAAPTAAPPVFDGMVLRFLSPLALIALAWPSVRTHLLLAIWASLRLFARQPPERLLDHPRRRLLLDLIEKRPGIRPKELQDASMLANGPFRFHLQVLVRNGFVRQEAAGRTARLFARDAPAATVDRDDLQERLRRLLVARPGLSQIELAELLGVPVKSVHYHVTQWRRTGRVRLVAAGRYSRVYWTT